MDISVIIPLLNESDSLSELHSSLEKVMASNSFSYEVIFIDDGSSDDSWNAINRLSEENQSIKGIRFLKNYGKSQALHVGFLKAKGNVQKKAMDELQGASKPDLKTKASAHNKKGEVVDQGVANLFNRIPSINYSNIIFY